ncbi:uncharacterized protein B0J16DRAFT_389639 [Fusarium flagelliforme]|uniref:uncharacterized protein n=1 Tax=Fusarium flagelliforme TaxID=2675880 RepID=UPI001E8CA3E3|nr:uncharacterized protein B0J16DRAFT_389639 [Fusarium flagelliforme]KAH7173754.1 hypothetical protein B0J16DRAFT_389639 [Fusarium flagelliforme]
MATGGAAQTQTGNSMLAFFIHDTSSLQDRLIVRAMIEDDQLSKKGADQSEPKDSKL